MLIRIRERTRRMLSDAERAAIDNEDRFWALVDAGYVSLRRLGKRDYEIGGHKYVGRAIAGDLELEVAEKADGAVRALVGAATGAEIRMEDLSAPAADFDEVSRHLIREFVHAAAAYVADRRQPRYQYVAAAGPVLGGVLDVTRTALLHASGRQQLFAYTSGRVIRDSLLDRVVLAALFEVDASAGALNLDAQTLYNARWLAGSLDEVRDAAFFSLNEAEHLANANDVDRAPDIHPFDRDLARLAAVTLLHRGFAPDDVLEQVIPRAWFIDLETLFEQAVRATLRVVLPTYAVDRGESFERRMFVGGSDHSRTNPDLVIVCGSDVAAVGDVKYKSLREAVPDAGGADTDERRRKKEGRPDLYQVLVHASSLEADKAFLLFVSDDVYACRYLGRAATGSDTWAAQVRPGHLRDDLNRFTAEIGLVEDGS